MSLQDKFGIFLRKSVSIFLCFTIVLLTLTMSGCGTASPQAVTKTGLYFDTVITITLYSGGRNGLTSKQAEGYIDSCFDMASSYEQHFSTTIETSDVARINHSNGEWVDVDASTVEVIERGLEYGQLSYGRFSICCGAITDLWEFGTEEIPDEELIKEALLHVGDEIVELDETNFKVKLTDPMARLDLGAIAKGYIADSMKAYLKSEGIDEGIINLGGNVLLLGEKSFGDGTYRIGIQEPFAKDGQMLSDVVATDKSIVTSGSYQRYFIKDDVLYHHIIDLSTGYPARTGLSAVTIISDNSCEGDALSTICFLLGKDEGQKLCDELGVEAVFVESEDAAENTVEDAAENAAENTVEKETKKEAWSLNLVMVGDVLLHDRIEEYSVDEQGEYNFDALFANTKEKIESADVAIANQEVIIGGKDLRVTGYPTFNAPFEAADALVDAGFDIVCQGTNHALDRGRNGIINCDDYWEENYPQIAVLGIHNDSSEQSYYIYEKEGKKIAFLNYTYGTNGIALPEDMPYSVDLLNEEKVISDLETVNEIADFTVVCPHWGTEYNLDTDSMQKKWTKIFLDHGVDLVIGTHPHVIEPVEMVMDDESGNSMLVYYSLGNFVNWTSGSGSGTANRMLGIMADVTLGVNESDEIIITEYKALPLVAHVKKEYGGVTTYFLEDYSQDLASQNEITKQDANFSFEYIQELFDRVINQ